MLNEIIINPNQSGSMNEWLSKIWIYNIEWHFDEMKAFS